MIPWSSCRPPAEKQKKRAKATRAGAETTCHVVHKMQCGTLPGYRRPAEPRGQTFSLHLQPGSLLLSHTVIPSPVFFSSLIQYGLILHPSTLSCHLFLHQNYHNMLYCAVLLSTFSLPHFLFYSTVCSSRPNCLVCFISHFYSFGPLLLAIPL